MEEEMQMGEELGKEVKMEGDEDMKIGWSK
jgi:hypothetical protein